MLCRHTSGLTSGSRGFGFSSSTTEFNKVGNSVQANTEVLSVVECSCLFVL